MGRELDIYRLYSCRTDVKESFLLVKATRPEFPNWSQTAENEVIDEVDFRFAAILKREQARLSNGVIDFIAAWEGGIPEGDVFYEDASGVEVKIWMSFDTVHNGYFVFGNQPDEVRFWDSLKVSHKYGEANDPSEYQRPAKSVIVVYLQ